MWAFRWLCYISLRIVKDLSIRKQPSLNTKSHLWNASIRAWWITLRYLENCIFLSVFVSFWVFFIAFDHWNACPTNVDDIILKLMKWQVGQRPRIIAMQILSSNVCLLKAKLTFEWPLTADAESTPSYSSDLHFSVLQNRPNRGALLCSKKI